MHCSPPVILYMDLTVYEQYILYTTLNISSGCVSKDILNLRASNINNYFFECDSVY